MVLVLLSALRKIRPKPSPCCPTAGAPCGTLGEKKKKGVSHAVYSKVESYISEKKVVSTRGCCAIAMAADGGQAFTPEA